jgi:hypothetical protein
MRSSVLPDWAASCGAECVQVWNDTIGKSVGIAAPMP